MATIDCSAVQGWLSQARVSHEMVALPAGVIAHVQACDLCRAALSAIVTLVPPGACEQCEADLPAYVDMVAATGQEAAGEHYPLVWWHLQGCAACAALYRQILAARQAPELQSLSAGLHTQQPQLRVHIPRSTISLIQLQAAVLGPPRGLGHSVVLGMQEDEGTELTLRLVQAQAGAWQLVARVHLPHAGHLVLQIGTTVLRAPLGPDGQADVIIPEELLANDDGPGIEATIEPEDRHL